MWITSACGSIRRARSRSGQPETRIRTSRSSMARESRCPEFPEAGSAVSRRKSSTGGSDLRVRFSGGNAGGEYTGSATLDQLSQTSLDLSVGSPSVSDSSPAAGASFTLSATVSNTGDGESVATTLRYYRSTDADDHAVGHGGGHGSGSGAGRFGEQQRVGGPDRAGEPGDILLRCVCGRGDGRVRHDQQLLGIGAGGGGDTAAIAGSAGLGSGHCHR